MSAGLLLAPGPLPSNAATRSRARPPSSRRCSWASTKTLSASSRQAPTPTPPPQVRLPLSASSSGVRVQADVRAPRVLTLARRRCAGGERALLIAAKAGREDLVELIAGFKADVNAGDAMERTALHLASDEGHLAVVQFLVKVGANVEAKEQVSLKRETLTRAQTDT